MAQRTRDELVAEVGFRLGIDVSSGSDGETAVIDGIDDAQRRVWYAKEWPERRSAATIFTVGPYTTGTATLTNASTSVTGTGTTWTTAFSNRKIALALGEPHYLFTRTADTTGTIPTGGYAEATATDSEYVIFADEYDVATDVDRIVSVSVYRPEWGGRMIPLEESAMDAAAFVHGLTGTPMYWTVTNSTTAGTKRIRVWPIPDTAYRIRVRYWKSCSDLSSGSSTSSLGANKDRLLLYASLLEAQTFPGAVQITSEKQINDMIDLAWVQQADRSPLSFRKARFDDHIETDAIWLDAEGAI